MSILPQPPVKQSLFAGSPPAFLNKNPAEDFLAGFASQKSELESKLNNMVSGGAVKNDSQEINASNWSQFQGSDPMKPSYQPQSLIDYYKTGKTTSERMDGGEIPYTMNVEPKKSIGDIMASSPTELLGSLAQGASNAAKKIKDLGYADVSPEKEAKIKAFIKEKLDAGVDPEIIKQALKKAKDEGKLQGGWTDNPVTGTIASIVSAPLQGASTMLSGEAKYTEGVTNVLEGDKATGSAQMVEGVLGSGLGALGLATGFTPVGAGVNTALNSDTVAEPMSKYIVEPTKKVTALGQELVGFDPNSEASKSVQESAGMVGPLAVLGAGQKYAPKVISKGKNVGEAILPKVEGVVSKAGEKISNKVSSIGEGITRGMPEKTIANDLKLTPTERASVEKILGGKTPEQYILEKNLGGKGKGELAEIFMKQADDNYNGITEKLGKIKTSIKSDSTKVAINDMLETFDSLSNLEKSTYKNDIAFLQKLAKQDAFTPAEMNAIRRAFDKVNTGMYTAKGAIRSGTRAEAEVTVRNGISKDIQDIGIKNGVDVKKMNQELRVGLTLKDGLLRALSQENKNNLVGLQDIGIMGVLSGGNPATAISLGIGKKFLEGKAPKIAQKLFNLNKTPYAESTVTRGNTISTGDGSRLFGGTNTMGNSSSSSISKGKVDLGRKGLLPNSSKGNNKKK